MKSSTKEKSSIAIRGNPIRENYLKQAGSIGYAEAWIVRKVLIKPDFKPTEPQLASILDFENRSAIQQILNCAFNKRKDYIKRLSDEWHRAVALVDPSREIDTFGWTDIDCAARFHAREKDFVAWIPQMKKWFVWEGKRWTPSKLERVVSKYKSMVDDLMGYPELPSAMVGSLASWRTMNDVISMSKDLFESSMRDFDSHPHLLNCENGTVDLYTKELLPHDPKHRITKICPTNYVRDALSRRWEKFEGEIFAGDQELSIYVRRSIGYALSGDTKHQHCWVFIGEGANGKGKYFEVVNHVFGKDLVKLGSRTLVVESPSGQEPHPTEIAELQGCRLVYIDETKANDRLNVAKVKYLTGTEDAKGRFMGQDFFEFRRTCKLYVLTNDLPLVSDTSNAVWRRIRIVPMIVSFVGPNDKVDGGPPLVLPKNLNVKEELMEESEGILSMFVDACHDVLYLPNALAAPKAVMEASERYKTASDPIQGWINDCCIIHESNKCETMHLYKSFVSWCKDNGFHPMTCTRFSGELSKRKFAKYRSNQSRGFFGIAAI